MISRPPFFPRISLYLAGLYSIVLLLAGVLFVNFTVDDAFITFRYGKNLYQNGLWAWNQSDAFQPVEAYTNPLFAFLSIPVHFLQVPVMVAYKAFGLATLIATFIAATSGLNQRSKIISIAFTCTNFYIFPHAFSGLETLLFLLLIFIVLEANPTRLASGFFSLLIFIAPLIRPEGALASAYILYQQCRNKSLSRWSYLAIALGLVYFYWRYAFFQKMLPNTFYVKMHSGSLAENIKTEQFIILLGISSIAALQLIRAPIFFPLLLLLGYVGVNLTSDMQMNYCHRFGYHLVIPIAFHALKQTLHHINLTPTERKAPARRVAALFTIAILFVFAAKTISFRSTLQILDYYPSAVASHKRLGQALSKAKLGDTIMAVGDAGLIPYYSGLPTIDFIGLASSEIGTWLSSGVEPKLPRPDIVIIYSKSPTSCEFKTGKYPGLDLIARQHLNHSRYTCHTGPNWAGDYYLNALISTESPKYSDLQEVFINFSKEPATTKNGKQIFHDATRFLGLRADLAG